MPSKRESPIKTVLTKRDPTDGSAVGVEAGYTIAGVEEELVASCVGSGDTDSVLLSARV